MPGKTLAHSCKKVRHSLMPGLRGKRPWLIPGLIEVVRESEIFIHARVRRKASFTDNRFDRESPFLIPGLKERERVMNTSVKHRYDC